MAHTPNANGNDTHNDSEDNVTDVINEDVEVDCDFVNEEDTHDLPKSLIVTNVADDVYENESVKEEFESVFRQYHPNATFQYLKSFRRARVNYDSPAVATRARIHFHETEICGKTVKCYFIQPEKMQSSSGPHLLPPAPEKQFLISPPSSPPVGWESIPEATPVVNYELIAALSRLTPGDSHELHPQTGSQPAIIVHTCEDMEVAPGQPRMSIAQTRCPARKT